MDNSGKKIHMVGIGGSGMCGIAEVLVNLGYTVTGSDIHPGPVTSYLENLGIKIFSIHEPSNVEGSDVVVYSSAVNRDNCEIKHALDSSIPVVKRAEMLAELMRMKHGIAVAGSHGKTTTTSMVAEVLTRGGLDPTLVVGGRIACLGGNAKMGKSDLFVAEVDESDGSFMNLVPTTAIITSIDYEHMDYYGTMARLKQSFTDFINKLPFYGIAIVCINDEEIRDILPGINRRYVTYGSRQDSEFSWKNVYFDRDMTRFDLVRRNQFMGEVLLDVPGIHNVANSVAAIIVGLELGLKLEIILEALENYVPVDRRFQVVGEVENVLIVDDYGHHPTEIKATLKAARKGWGRRIITVFQPHRYTRSKLLLDKFGESVSETDILITTKIYPAGEKPIAGVTGKILADTIKSAGTTEVYYKESFEEILDFIVKIVKPGDMVITLGAGDVYKVGKMFLETLVKREISK